MAVTVIIEKDGLVRVMLPEDWRQRYGLNEGDEVSLVEKDGELVVVPGFVSEHDDDPMTPEEEDELVNRLQPYMTEGQLDLQKLKSASVVVSPEDLLLDGNEETL